MSESKEKEELEKYLSKEGLRIKVGIEIESKNKWLDLLKYSNINKR
jgi:hypothetical protein